MKGAPDWNKPGDSVEGVWKEELLRWLGQVCNLDVLVETGTCEASTILAIRNSFTDIYSIELSYYYYEKARARVRAAEATNLHLYYGSSHKLLHEVIDEVRAGPILFWLDAHSSGGLTANEGDPLAEEIDTISKMRPDSLVVIDDLKDAELRHVTDAGVKLDAWTHREYRTGVILMHQGGFQIPAFEA